MKRDAIIVKITNEKRDNLTPNLKGTSVMQLTRFRFSNSANNRLRRWKSKRFKNRQRWQVLKGT